MNKVARLHDLAGIKAGLRLPAYVPTNHGVGIVHLGLGAFSKAHLAAYTDTALATNGGDWRIAGVSLRSENTAAALNPQQGLYTLLEHGADGVSARIIGSIAEVIPAAKDRAAALAALTAPTTRIVSLTVSEKAYGIERTTLTADETHPAVAHDLAHPAEPQGVLGYLVCALKQRFKAGLEPFTVLCCDNLPANGKLIRAGVIDYAKKVESALADQIAEQVAFPSTMVDRIVPAASAQTLALAQEHCGLQDLAAVESESFSQWMIEDNFTSGRPAWEAGGATFVDDVTPYEEMKLRLVNSTHSLIAYAGFLCGHSHVRDAMADPCIARLAKRHLSASVATLDQLPGIDLPQYASEILIRFANPAIAHETYQIAMDGTEKLPQRFLSSAMAAIARKHDIRPFAFAVAVWMRYCLGCRDNGTEYELRDPMAGRIAAGISGREADAKELSKTLFTLPGVFPQELLATELFTLGVAEILQVLLEQGVVAVVRAESKDL